MTKYIGSLIFLLFLPFLLINSQNIENLRKEREALLEEISNTSRLIEEKKENREDNLRELNLINSKIKNAVLN